MKLKVVSPCSISNMKLKKLLKSNTENFCDMTKYCISCVINNIMWISA